jgi:hypothetical protein
MNVWRLAVPIVISTPELYGDQPAILLDLNEAGLVAAIMMPIPDGMRVVITFEGPPETRTESGEAAVLAPGEVVGLSPAIEAIAEARTIDRELEDGRVERLLRARFVDWERRVELAYPDQRAELH